MNNNAKFYGILAAVVLAVVVPSVLLLGGYGLLLDCVLFAALAAWAD